MENLARMLFTFNLSGHWRAGQADLTTSLSDCLDGIQLAGLVWSSVVLEKQFSSELNYSPSLQQKNLYALSTIVYNLE